MPRRPSFYVKVEGVRDVRAALRSISPAVESLAVGAVAEGSSIIAAEAKRRVRQRSGKLAQSIDTTVRADGLEATTGSDLPYARFVELGTRKAPAHPWLFPAFKKGARHVRKTLREGGKDLARIRFKTKRRKPRAG